MSIEPTCDYCGLVDKGRCKTFEASEECPHAPVEGKVPIIQSGPLAGLTRQKYGAIYADPAWTFATRSNKGKGRSPEQHYDCMTLAEIKAMPVAELAAKDCVLFMWVIDTHLEMGLDVIREWGFKYKTRAFEWTKLQKNIADYPVEDRDVLVDKPIFMGGGFWTRANNESCLLATRGSPKRINADVRRAVLEPRREHSRKPDRIRTDIERLVAGPYCELFSRTTRPGWDMMGNQTGKFADGAGIDYNDPELTRALTEEEQDAIDEMLSDRQAIEDLI